MLRIKIFGTSNIGLYIYATNKYILFHSAIPKNKIDLISGELKAPYFKVDLTETLITAPFIVGNSNGILVPNIFEDYALKELEMFAKELDVNLAVLDSKYNALGNIIVANDNGALVSPLIPYRLKKIISDVLDVETSTITIGRFSYIGSLIVANNDKGLVAPVVKEDERLLIEDILNIKVNEGTVNGGTEFIKLGLVVNDFGVVVGEDTTGAELMNISMTFEGGLQWGRIESRD